MERMCDATMIFQRISRSWKLRFAKHVVIVLTLVLFSGCTGGLGILGGSQSPNQSQGFRYNHHLFTIELTDVEVFDSEIKMTFMYTNRTDVPQPAGVSTYPSSPYLVDNLGKRYHYAANSFGGNRSFSPQIPEEIWITFARMPGSVPGSSVNLILPWRVSGGPRGQQVQDVQAPRSLAGARSQGNIDVTFRDVVLPTRPSKASPGRGFLYDHRLFSIELKKVEIVDGEVRINFTYTNRTDRPQSAGISTYPSPPYLIDNLGKRYQYVRNSFGGNRSNFPSQAPEDISLTFGKIQPGASSVGLVLPWQAQGVPVVTITFRDIPLDFESRSPRATGPGSVATLQSLAGRWHGVTSEDRHFDWTIESDGQYEGTFMNSGQMVHLRGQLTAAPDGSIRYLTESGQRGKFVVEQEPSGAIVLRGSVLGLGVSFELRRIDDTKSPQISRAVGSSPSDAVGTAAQLTRFLGTWENIDSTTRGITRLDIRASPSEIFVHAGADVARLSATGGEVRAEPYGPSVSSAIQAETAAGPVRAAGKTPLNRPRFDGHRVDGNRVGRAAAHAAAFLRLPCARTAAGVRCP